jgi:hypothetical protein
MLRRLPVESFDPVFFQSRANYNRLMMDSAFYERFADFRHMLIYQTDALVFEDRLREWCDRDYDYVGAPWISQAFPDDDRSYTGLPAWTWRKQHPDQPRVYRVGNGGFSLRKIEPCLRILRELADIREIWGRRHEDVFWCLAVPECVGSAFRIPAMEEAFDFALETNPSEGYARNGNRPPFGAHAWQIYEPLFWRNLCRRHGFRIPPRNPGRLSRMAQHILSVLRKRVFGK